jgi:hypothetical protein
MTFNGNLNQNLANYLLLIIMLLKVFYFALKGRLIIFFLAIRAKMDSRVINQVQV